jgi:hypothetical protein
VRPYARMTTVVRTCADSTSCAAACHLSSPLACVQQATRVVHPLQRHQVQGDVAAGATAVRQGALEGVDQVVGGQGRGVHNGGLAACCTSAPAEARQWCIRGGIIPERVAVTQGGHSPAGAGGQSVARLAAHLLLLRRGGG